MRKVFFGEPPKPVNQNEPKISEVKTITIEGDVNMGPNSGQKIKNEDTTQQPDKPYSQAGSSWNKPTIERIGKLISKGNINMGPNSGSTILTGKKAPKAKTDDQM